MKCTNTPSFAGRVSVWGLLSGVPLSFALPVFAQQLLSPHTIVQPADAIANNQFGRSPVLHGGKLFVGASGIQNGGSSGMGGVYVFDVQTLVQESYITATTTPPELPPEQFGQSIAVQDGRLLVGSREDHPTNPMKAGAAYLFEYPSGTQLARYTQTFGSSVFRSMFFGARVALIGDLAVVSDHTADWEFTGFVPTGTVNFFDIPTGQQVASLVPTGAPYGEYDRFGSGLASWNDQLIVGFENANSVHVYDPATRELLYEISPPANPFYFGHGMAVHGNTLVVSDSANFFEEFFPTAIYMYDLTTRELIRTITITPDTGDLGLGRVVALNDTYLLATRRRLDSPGVRVLVYDVTTGNQLGELIALSDASHNGFVYGGMAIEGHTAYIGNDAHASLPNPGGAVLVYDLSQLGTPCIADTNADGVLSPADFGAWVAAFNAMAPECDQNGDGACTPADFGAWVGNFNVGC